MEYLLQSSNGYIGLDKHGSPTIVTSAKQAKSFVSINKAKKCKQSLSKFLKRYVWIIIENPNTLNDSYNDNVQPSSNVLAPTEYVEFDINFVDNIEDNIIEIEQRIREACLQKQSIVNQLSLCDKKLCDIMHKIELSKFNVCQGYALCKMIKDVRIERRKCKNALDILGVFFDTNLEGMASLQIKKKIKNMHEREYTPRILKDLFE